jgi:hypothetical protein
MKTFSVDGEKRLGHGAVLPSGKVVVAWVDEDIESISIYPDMETLHKQQEGNIVKFQPFTPDGYKRTTFKVLEFPEGTDIVNVIAFGCVFFKGAVIEWKTGIVYYSGFDQKELGIKILFDGVGN